MHSNQLVLTALGDLAFGDHSVCVGHGVRSLMRRYGPEFFFENVKNLFESSDVLMGNLENVLSDVHHNPKKLASVEFRGMPKAVKGLKSARFDLVTLANNHALNHGLEAFHDTLTLLDTHQIKYTGVCDMDGKSCRPALVETKDLKIGFLAYSFQPDKYYNNKHIYCVGELKSIKRDISRLNTKVDIVVLSLHWGYEFMDYPSLEQVEIGRELIEAGAHIIIGHHPHVLQGIELYRGGIIAYSLGNFICDMSWDIRHRESLILQIHISKGKINNYKVIPIRINRTFQPEILEGNTAVNLFNRIKQLSISLEREDFRNRTNRDRMYSQRVAFAVKTNRIASWKYFASNIHRYPASYILQSVYRSFKRHLI